MAANPWLIVCLLVILPACCIQGASWKTSKTSPQAEETGHNMKTTFVTKCTFPPDITPYPRTHCWINQTLLATTQKDYLSTFEIREDGSCKLTTIDSGYTPAQIACTSQGEIYAAEFMQFRIKIYNLATGTMSIWKPEEPSAIFNIVLNEDMIVISDGANMYVYNTEREFLYMHTMLGYDSIAPDDLNADGLLVGVATNWDIGDRDMIIHDMKKDKTIIIGVERILFSNISPYDNILVGDGAPSSVNVFSFNGDRIGTLDLDVDDDGSPVNMKRTCVTRDKPAMLAAHQHTPDNTVWIYRLTEEEDVK